MIRALLAGLLVLVKVLLLPTTRPGVQIVQKTAPPPRSSPTDTGTWFVAGLCDKGSALRPINCRSLDDFITQCGARQTYSVLYDAVDLFFREGGSNLWVARVVGPAAVQAFRNLVDNVAAVSLIVKAQGPGTSGNNLKVAVVAGVAGGTYQIQITDNNNVVLEQSPDLTTQADAVNWAQTSQNVTITIGASLLAPVVAGANVLTALATGADDRTNIVDAQWLTALNLFSKDLGPGQVSAPGRTTDPGHTQLLDHAGANNRTALLDAPDTPTVATLQSSAVNAKTTNNGQYGALYAPWVLIPGVVAGTTRTAPPSAFQAAQMAEVDASDGPNVPAAGSRGIARYATGLSQPAWDDATRNTLNTSGVNVLRVLNNLVTIYGYRSLADPINNAAWLMLNNVRVLMAIAAEAYAIGQQFVFAQIDGQGQTISAYGGALSAMCQRYWNSGQLYGVVASEAFNVDVGPTVNTPLVIAGGELRATVAVRPSPEAELVTLNIVNVQVPLGVS